MALDDVLGALASIDPRKSKVVDLKLQVSAPTVMRDWKLAKSWIRREMKRF